MAYQRRALLRSGSARALRLLDLDLNVDPGSADSSHASPRFADERAPGPLPGALLRSLTVGVPLYEPAVKLSQRLGPLHRKFNVADAVQIKSPPRGAPFRRRTQGDEQTPFGQTVLPTRPTGRYSTKTELTHPATPR